jgi:hypothetical protein
MRMIFVAAALASVSFSPRHAEAAAAPWCAVISLGTGDVHWDCQYHSFEDCYRRGNILAPRSKRRPGNVALANTKTGASPALNRGAAAAFLRAAPFVSAIFTCGRIDSALILVELGASDREFPQCVTTALNSSGRGLQRSAISS